MAQAHRRRDDGIRPGLWLPVVAYAGLIFYLSSISVLPAPPGFITDKHVHFLMYGGLSALLVRALAGGQWSRVTTAVMWGAVLVATLYGVTDEFHQSFVPGRSTSAADLLADALGALTAAGLLLAWAIIRRR